MPGLDSVYREVENPATDEAVAAYGESAPKRKYTSRRNYRHAERRRDCSDGGDVVAGRGMKAIGKKITRSKYELVRWTRNCTRILQLAYSGHSDEHIASRVGVSVLAVKQLRGSQLFREHMFNLTRSELKLTAEKCSNQTLIEAARDILEKASIDAASKVKAIMQKGQPNQRLQFDACKDILDRAGLNKKETIQHLIRQYTPEEIKSALETLKEVEEVSQRMSNQQSQYVLKNDVEVAETTLAESPVTDADSRATGAEPAGSDRPQTEPAEPILSV